MTKIKIYSQKDIIENKFYFFLAFYTEFLIFAHELFLLKAHPTIKLKYSQSYVYSQL